MKKLTDKERVELLEKIATLAADQIAEADWHELSENQQKLVFLLQDGGYLEPATTGGLVGRAV